MNMLSLMIDRDALYLFPFASPSHRCWNSLTASVWEITHVYTGSSLHLKHFTPLNWQADGRCFPLHQWYDGGVGCIAWTSTGGDMLGDPWHPSLQILRQL